MTTYFTAYPAHPLGRWLVAFIVSLGLLALAYDHAPDPAWCLGLSSPSTRTLATSRPALDRQRGHRLASGQRPTLAAAQVSPAAGRSRLQFAQ